jgi:hypothetical protein
VAPLRLPPQCNVLGCEHTSLLQRSLFHFSEVFTRSQLLRRSMIMEPALPLFWSAPLLLFPCLMICSSSTTSSLLSAQLFFISLCSSCPWDGLLLSFSPSHLSILGRSPRRQSRFKSIKLSQRPFSYLSLWESLTLLASHSQRFEFDPLRLPCLPPCPHRMPPTASRSLSSFTSSVA